MNLYWLAPIEVSDHARVRARERRVFDSEAEITAMLRSAILQRRYSAIRPSWVYGGEASPEPKDGVYYIWDAEVSYCWIISAARSGALYVRTLVLPPGRRAEIAANSHLLGSRTR